VLWQPFRVVTKRSGCRLRGFP